jgi:hypothetical protein
MFGFFGTYDNAQHGVPFGAALNLLPVTAKEKRFIAYSVARWGVYSDFWELLNESDASGAWTTLMADYTRSIDPDQKPITSSELSPTPWVPGVDFVDPHWYESEDELASDSRVGELGGDWQRYGLPVIVGEQGNTGQNWDPRSALRMRIRTWASLFEQIGLVFWNTSWSKAGMNEGSHAPGSTSNIYLGPEERGYIHTLRGFASQLDADVRPVSMTVSQPSSMRVHGLASERVAAAYVHHFQDHVTPVAGQLTLHVPGDAGADQPFVGRWIDPATGAEVARVRLSSGPQTVDIPTFVVDLALLVTREQQ